jgi:2-polyprenyl-3-methyl-5-hydroxy-6-metoxy-1,4-benzoquinol methylase
MNFKVVECSCGLIFINPRLSAEAYAQYYDEAYFTGKKDYHSEAQFAPSFEQTYLPFVDLILRNQVVRKDRGKYLDIGCATGHLVAIFKRLGWDATGIDVSEYSTKYGREVRELNIITGTLVDVSFPTNYFDLISMIDVVEHLPNPKEYIVEVARILAPGGTFVLTTPNAGCLIAKLRREKWWSYSKFGHLHFFTIPTLSKLLAHAGLYIHHIKNAYCYGNSLRELLKLKVKKSLLVIRILEYLLTTKFAPRLFRISQSLTNFLVPITFFFIGKRG